MKLPLPRGWLLSAALVVTGCGFFSKPQVVEEPPADAVTRLGETTTISLADWLALPRPELARLADEYAEAVAKHVEFTRHNPEAVSLLPRLRLSPRVPVFQQAKFSEAAGLSLPPYLAEGHKDAAVALHLARLGDTEAAFKLVDPANEKLAEQVHTLATDKNYPAEWTRLVALALYSAQFELAGGDVDAATKVALLHKQLTEILDARAAKGPLGAALLPLGRRALTQAAAAWRSPTHQKPALAADLDAVLAAWGEVRHARPRAGPQSKQGRNRADPRRTADGFNRLCPGSGRARGLDLLDLPVVTEGVDALVAFLDGDGKLGELRLVYRARINQEFPEPADLAQPLEDRGITAKAPTKAEGVVRQDYVTDGSAYDVTVFTRTTRLGAIVRVSGTAGSTAVPRLPQHPRDLGPVHLDRSFEANRLSVKPDEGGDKVEVDRPAVLALFTRPLADPRPVAAILRREVGHNLVGSLSLRWTAENNALTLSKFLLPLWSACGVGAVEAVNDDTGGCLTFTWKDGTTRYSLRLPNEDQLGTELLASDSRGAGGREGPRRGGRGPGPGPAQGRLAAGKPLKRLPRTLHQEGLTLGMTKTSALATLPRGQMARQTQLADGVSVLFLSPPAPTATYSARQLFARFGPDNKLAEIRVRYQIGPKPPSKDHPALLDTLRKSNGAPDVLPAPWTHLWTDLPAQKPAAELLRWADDVTVLTYQHDAGGAEVTLTDCDADHADGVPLPPLRFCSRGVEACNLGDTRATCSTAGSSPIPSKPMTGLSTSASRTPAPTTSCWPGLRPTRWCASSPGTSKSPARPSAASRSPPPCKKSGAATSTTSGALRRQNGFWGQIYGSYGWHDDKTRVLTHVQDTEQGPRLFTEWREWPLPDKTVAAKP